MCEEILPSYYSQAPNDDQEELELKENVAYKATTLKLQENTAYAVATHELQDQTTTDIIINLKDFELHENAAYISTTYKDFELHENTAYISTTYEDFELQENTAYCNHFSAITQNV